MPTAIELIAAERQRQISVEGWAAEHDDNHHDGSLAIAAACYALPEDDRMYYDEASGVKLNRKTYEHCGERHAMEDTYYKSFTDFASAKQFSIDVLKRKIAGLQGELDAYQGFLEETNGVVEGALRPKENKVFRL